MGRKADGVLTNARLWTGEDPRLVPDGEAHAVAVGGGRVLAAGPEREVEPLRGPETWVLDVAGGWILPGFVDAHVHLLAGGLLLSSLDLREVESRDAFHQAVTRFAEDLESGEWIVGGNWEHQRWGGELPTREWLDAAAPGHPVLLTRTDMHVAVVSSQALERAGITAETPDPPGGEIDRDPRTGIPTGILRERAVELVQEVIPPPSPARRVQALRAAQAQAFRQGITQVHDMGVMGRDDETWEALTALRAGTEDGWLRLRVRAYMPMATRARVRDLVREEGPGDEQVRWDGVKAFVDGSLGAATAWFHEPYHDQPHRVGGPITELGELRHALLEADRWGLQCAVHAIGDRAVDWTLAIREEMVERYGPRDRRFRVEHAQHLAPAAATRFHDREEVFASVQPCHLVEDGGWAEQRLGPERARRSFAFRSLREGGAALAFGSDWTVAPLDPLAALDAAVHRRVRDGARPEGWIPEERLALGEAVQAHSATAARAGFMEPGAPVPGSRADLVVVSGALPDGSEGPDAPPPSVDLTLAGGEVVHARDGALRQRQGAPAPVAR